MSESFSTQQVLIIVLITICITLVLLTYTNTTNPTNLNDENKECDVEPKKVVGGMSTRPENQNFNELQIKENSQIEVQGEPTTIHESHDNTEDDDGLYNARFNDHNKNFDEVKTVEFSQLFTPKEVKNRASQKQWEKWRNSKIKYLDV